MCLVVRGLAVTHHGHDIGKRHAWAIVLIGVEEDTKALELVGRPKHRAHSTALLGEPQSETIAVQVAIPMDLELKLDLDECKLVEAIM